MSDKLKRVLCGLGAVAISAISLQSTQARIITFDSHPTDFNNPIFDSGFTFQFAAAGWGVFGPSSGACCSVNYDGTTALYADGGPVAHASVVITPTAGGTFTVSSLDAATYWFGAIGALNIVGDVSGGGTATDTLSVNDDFQHFALPSDFTDLTRLTLSDSQAGFFLQAPGFGIDNLDFGGATVPEPATWVMMLAAFGGLGAAMRSRRKLTAASA